MSSLGYADLLGLLGEVERIGQAQTLKISLEALAGPAEAPGSPGPTMFDAIRTNDLLYEETQRLRNLLLGRIAEIQRAARPAAAIAPDAPASQVDDAPRSWTEGEILGLLDGAQMAMIKHPTATQAAFAALVREGRRFAETAEGKGWLDVLSASSFMRQARWVWETTSLNMLEEDAGTIVPSTYLEALLRAAEVPDLEQLLGRVTGMGHE
jgi:hypothetical protein